MQGANGFIFIPILPEVIDSFAEEYGIVEGEDEVVDGEISDRSSALYGFFYYIGMIVSPIMGSLIYAGNHSFNKTCDVFAVITLAYTLLYLVFNVLPDMNKMKKPKTVWRGL